MHNVYSLLPHPAWILTNEENKIESDLRSCVYNLCICPRVNIQFSPFFSCCILLSSSIPNFSLFISSPEQQKRNYFFRIADGYWISLATWMTTTRRFHNRIDENSRERRIQLPSGQWIIMNGNDWRRMEKMLIEWHLFELLYVLHQYSQKRMGFCIEFSRNCWF